MSNVSQIIQNSFHFITDVEYLSISTTNNVSCQLCLMYRHVCVWVWVLIDDVGDQNTSCWILFKGYGMHHIRESMKDIKLSRYICWKSVWKEFNNKKLFWKNWNCTKSDVIRESSDEQFINYKERKPLLRVTLSLGRTIFIFETVYRKREILKSLIHTTRLWRGFL